MAYEVLSAQAWASEQFGQVQLGDARLNKRVVRVAAALAADPQGSIPQQNKRWKETKGAYRLFDHDQATFESICQAHWEQTRLAAGASQQQVTLFVQDTTWLSFAAHPATTGLGRFGGKTRRGKTAGLGLFEHSVLAVEPEDDGSGSGSGRGSGSGSNSSSNGRVLGLAWGKLFVRDDEVVGSQDARRRSKRRTSPDRESTRWIEAVEQIGAAPPGGNRRWLHVGDRESDIFDLYEQTTQMPGVGFVVRLMQHRRNAVAGHRSQQVLSSSQRPKTCLKDICRSMPEMGRTQLWIAPGGNNGGRTGRWAKLAVAGGPVTIYSPWFGPKGRGKTGGGGSRTARSLCCWAVRVWEIDAPDGVEPIEWLLLSSEPVENLRDALRTAGYYSLRWLIEQYHQCLKSGCKVEHRQLESADRLAPLIGISSVVATRLLQLKNDARLTPDAPAERCVPAESVRTMARLLRVEPKTLTVRRFTHEVAKLGGFVGRRRDGEPGWLTLWRGWHELNLITLGYQLATGPPRYG